MKHVVVIEIDGVERDFLSIPEPERREIVNELNRRACTAIGYKEIIEPEKIQEAG